jgi:diguanylate cyclase (GGDEF)-like protein
MRWNRALSGLLVAVVLGGAANLAASRMLVGEFRDAGARAERDASALAKLRADVASYSGVLHGVMDNGVSAAFARRADVERRIRTEFTSGISSARDTEDRRLRRQALAMWEATLPLATPIAPAAPVTDRLAKHRLIADSTDAVAARLDKAGAAGRRETRAELLRADRLARYAVAGMLLVGVAMVLLVVRIGRRLYVEILRPVSMLRDSANRLAAGDLRHRVDIDSQDELGDLAESFNAMATTIEGSHRHLTRQANHDSLTGLANRAGLRSQLTAMLAQPQRRDGVEAVLLVDLDDFKNVNDSLGHSAGDDLLVEVADRLVDVIRPSDLASRLGGDEFAILLRGVPTEAHALAVAERTVAALADPFEIAGTTVYVGASVGLAVRRHDSDLDELLREADVAMYSAKGHGKNQVRRYDDESRLAPAS